MFRARHRNEKKKDVRLAQLDRAFGYGPKGRGFESSNARYPQTEVWGFLFAGKHEEISMKLKKVYKTLAVTIALSVTAPSGFTMDHNEKHTAHVHAAGLESGDAETSETTGLATAAETETAAQEPVSSEPATEPNTGTSEPATSRPPAARSLPQIRPVRSQAASPPQSQVPAAANRLQNRGPVSPLQRCRRWWILPQSRIQRCRL